MSHVPAEITIERPSEQSRWMWVWAVCQPDACWGEWESGTSPSLEAARVGALIALARVHRSQNLN